MVITISHREDRDHAGYGVTVRFADPTRPPLREAMETLAEVQAFLALVLEEPRYPRLRRRTLASAR